MGFYAQQSPPIGAEVGSHAVACILNFDILYMNKGSNFPVFIISALLHDVWKP